jgi:hypothetical protein
MPRHEDGAIVFWQLKWLDGWEHGWEQLSAALFYTAPNAQRLLRFIGSAVVELRGFEPLTSAAQAAARRFRRVSAWEAGFGAFVAQIPAPPISGRSGFPMDQPPCGS